MTRIWRKRVLLSSSSAQNFLNTMIMALGSGFFTNLSHQFQGLTIDYKTGEAVNIGRLGNHELTHGLMTFIENDEDGSVKSIAFSLDSYDSSVELIALRRGYRMKHQIEGLLSSLDYFLPPNIETPDNCMATLDVCVDKAHPNKLVAAIISFVNIDTFANRVHNDKRYSKDYVGEEELSHNLAEAGYEYEWITDPKTGERECLFRNNGLWYLKYLHLYFFTKDYKSQDTNTFTTTMLHKVLARDIRKNLEENGEESIQ